MQCPFIYLWGAARSSAFAQITSLRGPSCQNEFAPLERLPAYDENFRETLAMTVTVH